MEHVRKFIPGLFVWLNSRKTKTFLVGAACALYLHQQGAIDGMQALVAVVGPGAISILGTSLEDASAKAKQG